MVSVVIPTHNRCLLLKRAVESVLNQSYKELELIVVSDGSTDETELVMKRYSENDSRVRFIHYPEPKGANHARNTGVDESNGEFVAFLDDDDEWFPEKIEKQLHEFANDEKIGLVYSGIDIINIENGLHYLSIPKDKGDLRKDILFYNCINTTSSVIMKRNIFKEVGGFDEALPAKQDYDLWIRCLQITEAGFIKEPLLNYYISSGSNQISSHVERYIRANDMIDNKYNYLIDQLSKKEKRKRNAIKYSDLAKLSFRNNMRSECRRYCIKSLKDNISVSALGMIIASLFNYDFAIKVLQRVRKM